MNKAKKFADYFWDCVCIVSIVGIWPRFIEPNLLQITKKKLSIPCLSSDLEGIKVLHFSDLHWNASLSSFYVERLIKKINGLNPDIICFTGDFISRSCLENSEKLKYFFSSLKARFGLFGVLGNHDYQSFVTVSPKGQYDIEEKIESNIFKGFRRLFAFSVPFTGEVTEIAKKVELHSELIELLNKTPIKILNNESVLLPVKNAFLNICGLGDLSLGRFHPQSAFQQYDKKFPGIVLTHNPDSIPSLKNYPGFLILSGHTHGGQVSLPWISKKLTKMIYPEYKRGLKKLGNKWVYTNRGLGSIMKFRWFSIPELALFTLEKEGK